MISWVLNERVPKPGMDSRFLDLMRLRESVEEKDRRALNKVLADISRCPKEFDDKFEPALAKRDGGRIYSSTLLSTPLRSNAIYNQTGIGAHDYGIRLMRVVRLVRKDLKEQPKLNRSEDKGVDFALAREVNFLQITARWLITWGRRGFGYSAVKE